MSVSSSFACPLKILSFSLLLSNSLKLEAQNCDELRIAFTRVRDTLETKQRDQQSAYYSWKNAQKDLNGPDGPQVQLIQVEKELLEMKGRKDSKEYQQKLIDKGNLNLYINELKKKGSTWFTNYKDLEREVFAVSKRKNMIQQNLNKNCNQAVKINVSGTYNSTYGKVVLTQGKDQFAVEKEGDAGKLYVPLSAVVYYDNGSTSTLTGSFDGNRWSYDWHNKSNEYGTGNMQYNMSEKSFKGSWTNKVGTPYGTEDNDHWEMFLKKEVVKSNLIDVSGTYISQFGLVTLTQAKKITKGILISVGLKGVVNYTNGGSSTLTGQFDGVHWIFEWKNTFNQFGTGDMVYQSDNAFSGSYTDKSTTPSAKGYWWLRPK